MVARFDRPPKKGAISRTSGRKMSFDVWLSCYKHGEHATFPFSQVEGAFGSHAAIRKPDLWVVDYGDEGRGDMYVDTDGGDIGGFMVNRPPYSLDFWQGVLTLLRDTPS